MTYLMLHAERLHSIVTDQPLIPAADVAKVRDAAALLVEARRLRDAAEEDIAETRAAERERGFTAGFAEGKAAADAVLTETLTALATKAAEDEADRRSQIARLAIEVVRRMAGEIAAGTMVAGLAERATAELTDNPGVVVRVAPQNVVATQQRLSDRAVTVQADENLNIHDCVVDTSIGSSHAGLEIQLAALGRAWLPQ